MFLQLLNWRSFLSLVAITIVTGTVFYSNYLSKKIESDERKKVSIWAESLKTKGTTSDPAALNLTNIITNENYDIPIIETDEYDRPTGNFLNIDTLKIKTNPDFLKNKVSEFKNLHESIRVDISNEPLIYNKYYYGDSNLLIEIRYYPIIQLIIVALFITIMLITISTRNKSAQNQVWVGMAKETAHQLGTPISSLQGWVEMLKELPHNEKIASEMSKDVERLKLVSDRFGKIGSTPQLEPTDIIVHVRNMVEYIKRRSSEKISFSIHAKQHDKMIGLINPPLFDWVIENILKNALDAMEGKGSITIIINNTPTQITIDIADTGKGIHKKHLPHVFKPGFTTKKRGWGLGLSLSKRIMEHYHQGDLYVKSSELNKGTCFRIVLKNNH